jgi:hypothetical protein
VLVSAAVSSSSARMRQFIPAFALRVRQLRTAPACPAQRARPGSNGGRGCPPIGELSLAFWGST